MEESFRKFREENMQNGTASVKMLRWSGAAQM